MDGKRFLMGDLHCQIDVAMADEGRLTGDKGVPAAGDHEFPPGAGGESMGGENGLFWKSKFNARDPGERRAIGGTQAPF